MSTPTFSPDPLIYFLLHSGVFVGVLAALFFTLGFLLAKLIWSPYKRQTKTLLAEQEAQKGEIARLKRHLAEAVLSPTPSPSVVATPLPAATPFPKFSSTPVPEPTPPPPPPSPAITEPVPAAARPVIRSKSARPTPFQPASPSDAPNATENAPEPTPPPASSEPAPTEPTTKVASALSAIIHPQPPQKVAATGTATAESTNPPPAPSVAIPQPAEPVDDPVYGPIYREKPTNFDDLTRIKGVAAVLQGRLNRAGIYTFRQISSWNPQQVREFSNRLAFKDRIIREKWVEQATALLESTDSPDQTSAGVKS